MRLVTLFFTMIIWGNTFAQEVSIQLQNKGAQNTLYAAENNLTQINNLPKGAKVKMSYGYVRELSGGQFYLKEKYCNTSKNDTLIVYKGHEVLYKKSFKIAYRGAATISIDNIECLDSVDAAVFLKKNTRFVIKPDSLLYKIISFEMSIRPLRGEVIGPFMVTSGEFNTQHYEVIRRVKRGDLIFLDNIQYKSLKSAAVIKDDVIIYITRGIW